jgi:metal-sulfur cluster biosynthetic enzyme
MNRERTLSRDITVTQIPSGDGSCCRPARRSRSTRRSAGATPSRPTSACSGSTGRTATRSASRPPTTRSRPPTLADGAPDPEAVWDQLRKVYDPEIPVNIVDLGLVYSMDVEKLRPDNAYKVNVAMTLTAPGCGMGPAIAEDAKGKILLVPGVGDADVRITWDPPWNQSMISEEGKMKLGLV